MKKMKKNTLKKFMFIVLGLVITTILFAYGKLEYPNCRINGYDLGYAENNRDVDYVRIECESTQDGGSPVIEYIGESRYDNNDRWVYRGSCESWLFDGNKCTYKFTDFIGLYGEFRVSAVNKVGAGEPAYLGIKIRLKY